jgi:hypothetical protein
MSDIPRRLGVAAESRLDRAIDRAVREMMHVDPRPGFRGRVFAQLDPEPVQSSMFLRVTLTAGALAIVLVATIITVWYHETPPAPAVAQQEPSIKFPDVIIPGGPVAQPPSTGQRHVRRPPDPGSRPGRITSEPIRIPHVANVFAEPNAAVAAASVDADTVWAAPERQEEHPGALPPLVVPAVEPPAPIVIGPLIPRGPGL